MTTGQRIAIVGGGPGGLALARLLHCRGVVAQVFERDGHAGERPQGGSLDLHADTGQRALQLAGLMAAFQAEARPEDQGDRLYDAAGNLLFDRDGLGDNRPEIDRTALRQILVGSLAPETIRWGSKVTGVTPGADGGWDVAMDGHVARFDVVVGADGAWSRVRPLLSDVMPAYEGVTLVELGFDIRRHKAADELVGGGKMFAVGDNRALIAQRNGHGHIRGYAGLRMSEASGRATAGMAHEDVRADMLQAFKGWAPSLRYLIESGEVLGVRPLYALPAGDRWTSRPGLTLLGDAAHVMSPFGGEGVNLALADAADLADALTGDEGWPAVMRHEAAMAARARPAAQGAAEGLNGAFSSEGVAHVLAQYRQRDAM